MNLPMSSEGALMEGRTVVLQAPDDRDYARIEEWLAPTSLTAVLTVDDRDLITADQIRELNRNGVVRHFMVRVKSADSTIGCVNYKRSGPGCFEIGGAIGESELWRHGYGIEAFTLLLDHLFHARNAHRVQFTTAAFNQHIVAAATRSGFVCEGILRQCYFLDGQWHDAILWAMLREEFYAGLATTQGYDLRDVVPASEKAAARRILAEFLAANPGSTSIGQLAREANGHRGPRDQSDNHSGTGAAVAS
jgi:RimJ/RimL family protein N-acetyltransferase